MIRWLTAVGVLIYLSGSVSAEVITRPIEYKHDMKVLEGTFAYDTVQGNFKRPGILIAAETVGNGATARQRAIQFAKLGYVAFTLDLYGKGQEPTKLSLDPKSRALVRARAEAGYKILAAQNQVDSKRIGAVGYGIGGSALLELARSGADLEGVAVLHSDLSATDPAEAKKISASILVAVGSDDPQIPWSHIASFEDEMRGGGVDWQILRIGGAVHDFTNPAAGRQLKTGSAYDADADLRAHTAIKSFLTESFAASKPAPAEAKLAPKPAVVLKPGIPTKALDILTYVEQNHDAKAGYEGGRTFLNIERVLPSTDGSGRRIRYREWDVNPLRPGVNRGPERLVTGSDDSAYYTEDHYRTFKKIR